MIDNAYAKGQKLFWGSYFQYTPSGVSLAKKAGKYITDGSKVRRGDLAFLYYENLKRVGHVMAAYVVDIDRSRRTVTVKSIEGNTSGTAYERNGGCVTVKSYTVGFHEIGGKNRWNGFARPMFGNDTCTPEEFLESLEAEIGYIEKSSDKELNSKTANAGSGNWTKYGRWYGCNGVAWCAQFQSYCGYMACKKHLDHLKTGWEQQADGTWKYRVDGSYLKDSWEQISGQSKDSWYVFDGGGTMITGWFSSGDQWYYLNPEDGAMLSGQWIKADKKWYYLTKTGEMASSVYVRSQSEPGAFHWVDSDGSWNGKKTKDPDLYTFGMAE